jgi:hypothetical protein
MLRKALAAGVEAGESSFEEAVKPTPKRVAQRFEHYELVKGEDGKPVELGRGAMGVTYKAFDVDLHCPVSLKVISERYLGDESARLRFFARSTGGSEAAAFKRCLGIAPGQNWEQLFLRDGVRRGGDPRKSHQTLRQTGGEVGARNCGAGSRRFGSDPQTETRSPGHQTE